MWVDDSVQNNFPELKKDFFQWCQYFPTDWVKGEEYKTRAKREKSSEMIGVSRGVNFATRTGARACIE